MWVAVFVPSAAAVTLSCGSSTQTFNVHPGVNKLKIPLSPGKMSVKMVRNGQTIIDYTPSGYTYVTNPVTCEFLSFCGCVFRHFRFGSVLGSGSVECVIWRWSVKT